MIVRDKDDVWCGSLGDFLGNGVRRQKRQGSKGSCRHKTKLKDPDGFPDQGNRRLVRQKVMEEKRGIEKEIAHASRFGRSPRAGT